MNKTLKKCLAIVMSVVSVFSFSAVSFASETGNISDELIINEITNVSDEWIEQEITEKQPNAEIASPRAFPEYGRGRWYLGNFTFTNTNRGQVMRLRGNEVRICVAFKKADSQSSNIDLKVNLNRYAYENDMDCYFLIQANRFFSRDDQPDENGYYYFEGPWQDISYINGELFSLYYDAVTAYGQTGTGAYRSADVHVWLDID